MKKFNFIDRDKYMDALKKLFCEESCETKSENVPRRTIIETDQEIDLKDDE